MRKISTHQQTILEAEERFSGVKSEADAWNFLSTWLVKKLIHIIWDRELTEDFVNNPISISMAGNSNISKSNLEDYKWRARSLSNWCSLFLSICYRGLKRDVRNCCNVGGMQRVECRKLIRKRELFPFS